jgi:uncharacterized protein with NRDE domain
VCLLIALSRVASDAPLIMAANRDELYSRPAVSMTTLRDHDPRVLGGRDELAGGTWLAVNEHGVVAGLTNQPSPGGRDLTKRSRGAIPLAFAAYRTAREAVERVGAELDPADYNPCWLLVGDRDSLFSITVDQGHRLAADELPPGVHVLENAPLRSRSDKAARVTRLVASERAARAAAAPGGETHATIIDALAAVLSDHVPASPEPVAAGPVGAASSIGAGDGSRPARRQRPAATTAACVHTDIYGTRSALTVAVRPAGPPLLRVADGPPCEVPWRDVTALWSGPALV